MKTLGGGSCLKILTLTYGGDIVRGFCLNRKEIVCQNRVRVGFSLAVSLKYHLKRAHSISQTDVETEELHTICTDESKTVRVRFKLQKECAFGHEFFVVGDDPIIGLWDPSEGVQLDWSDGHVWTAELDIPSGKVIRYKFILKENTGTISWQPGPDRILQTWDTENTITVFEDWDNAELQNIVEEEREEQFSEKVLLPGLEEVADLNKELIDTNGNNQPYAFVISENTISELWKQETNTADRGSDIVSVIHQENEKEIQVNGFRSEDEKDPVPVLVPGLIPLPAEETEEEPLNEVETHNSLSNEDEELAESELKDNELASAASHPTESIDEESSRTKEQHYVNKLTSASSNPTETIVKESIGNKEQCIVNELASASLHPTEPIDENEHQYVNELLEKNVFEEDVQWGRRTLQKFLASFGFQVSL